MTEPISRPLGESARKAALSDVLWLAVPVRVIDRRVAKLERDAARRRNG